MGKIVSHLKNYCRICALISCYDCHSVKLTVSRQGGGGGEWGGGGMGIETCLQMAYLLVNCHVQPPDWFSFKAWQWRQLKEFPIGLK